MKNNNKMKCSKIEKFLWFKSEIENHNWIYISKEKRKCVDCKKVQIYFGRDSIGSEDWREFLK